MVSERDSSMASYQSAAIELFKCFNVFKLVLSITSKWYIIKTLAIQVLPKANQVAQYHLKTYSLQKTLCSMFKYIHFNTLWQTLHWSSQQRISILAKNFQHSWYRVYITCLYTCFQGATNMSQWYVHYIFTLTIIPWLKCRLILAHPSVLVCNKCVCVCVCVCVCTCVCLCVCVCVCVCVNVWMCMQTSKEKRACKPAHTSTLILTRIVLHEGLIIAISKMHYCFMGRSMERQWSKVEVVPRSNS